MVRQQVIIFVAQSLKLCDAMKQPQTLKEAIEYFSDSDRCFEYVVNLRWQDGVATCPHCNSEYVSFVASRKIWNCLKCKKQFSVRVGTVFEDSAIGLDKWLTAMWMVANAKNGISSCEIARTIGVTQKTAWFMAHRIRLAMQIEPSEPMSGEIEADETYIGGKAENMHKSKRERKVRGRGGVGKAIVMGILERKGDVRAKLIPDTSKDTLLPIIANNVEQGATVYTDANPSYNELSEAYKHEFVDHAIEYVRGRVHTNGIENYWSLFKRCIKGTYIHIDPEHIDRYLDEESFRFNRRTTTDAERFDKTASGIVGKRLTYKALTRKTIMRQLDLC